MHTALQMLLTFREAGVLLVGVLTTNGLPNARLKLPGRDTGA